MYIGNDLQIAHPSYKIIDDISSSFNGSTTSFALQVNGAAPVPFPISTQQVMISVNGVVQEPDPSGSAGFKLLGSNIVFSSAPANGHAFFGVINAGADYVTAGSEFPDGNAAAPSFTFQDDQDTGWFRSGSGSVGYSANGVQKVVFDGNGLTVTGTATATTFSGSGASLTHLNLGETNNTGTVAAARLGSGSSITSKFLRGDNTWQTISATTPGGSDTQVQYNNSGSFGSISTLTTDGSDITFVGASSKNIVWDTSAGSLIFNDSARAIFGTDSDGLEIFHESNNSYISDTGTGGLILLSNGTLIETKFGAEHAIKCTKDGSVELYHDNIKTFQTNTNGVIVQATEGGDANLFLYADEGDDDVDKWLIQSESDGYFAVKNNASGSYETSIKATGNGAVELFHDDSKKFETTASGITVTGTCTASTFSGSGSSLTSLPAGNLTGALPAISGANLTNLPPSGGSFTATASGALSAGDPVIMKTNGQVEKVTRSVTMESDPDVGAAVTTNMWPQANNDQSRCKTVYIPAQNKIVAVWMRYRQGQSSGNDDIFINSGTVADNGDVTWDTNGGNAIQTVGNSGARNSFPNVIYDDVNDRIIVGYRRNMGSGNQPYTVVITPDWTGGTWPSSGGSEQNVVSTGDYRILIHDKQYNRYICYYDNSGHKCKIGEMNANKNGITWGTEQSLTSDAISYGTWFWHPRDGSNGRHYIVYTVSGSNYPFKYLVHNVDGTNKTTSVTGTSTMYSSGYHYVWGEEGGSSTTWTTGTNYMCAVLHANQHGTQYLRLRVGYCNTTSISFNETQWASYDGGTSGGVGTYAYNQIFNIYWDSISERLVTTKWRRNGSNAWWQDFQMWTISGNTPSTSGAMYPGYNSMQWEGWGGIFTYIEGKNYALLYSTGVNYSNGYRYRIAYKVTNSTFTTNLLATNFAGFSSAAYSNGNTATIHVLGKVNENQTGLTTGSKYYVKDNGVLSTTAGNPSVVGGLAISSTKLLIKG